MGQQKNYIAYLRQSTMKQEISGLGVEAQREIIQNYLKERNRSLNISKQKAVVNLTGPNLRKFWRYVEKQVPS